MAAKKKTTRNRPEPKKKPLAKTNRAKKPPTKKAAGRGKKPASRKPSPRKPVRKSAPRTAKRPSPKRPVTGKKKPAPKVVRVANPEGLELARAVAAVALDKKAEDVVLLDLTSKANSVGYDYLVIASGDSDVQLDAMKNGVTDLLDQRKRRPSSIEPSPDWVCLNLDDVVVHFFTPDKRRLYDLEGLWSDAQRVPLS